MCRIVRGRRLGAEVGGEVGGEFIFVPFYVSEVESKHLEDLS
jgi:hypothetical protein